MISVSIKDIACSDPDGGTTVDKANAKATVDLDDGETISCTFTIEPIPQTPPPAPLPTCNGLDARIVGGPGDHPGSPLEMARTRSTPGPAPTRSTLAPTTT
jgi:hypothetical protein